MDLLLANTSGVGVMDALDTIVDTTLVVSELDYAEGVEGAEGSK